MSTDRRIGLEIGCRKAREWDARWWAADAERRRDADEADSQLSRAPLKRGRRVLDAARMSALLTPRAVRDQRRRRRPPPRMPRRLEESLRLAAGRFVGVRPGRRRAARGQGRTDEGFMEGVSVSVFEDGGALAVLFASASERAQRRVSALARPADGSPPACGGWSGSICRTATAPTSIPPVAGGWFGSPSAHGCHRHEPACRDTAVPAAPGSPDGARATRRSRAWAQAPVILPRRGPRVARCRKPVGRWASDRRWRKRCAPRPVVDAGMGRRAPALPLAAGGMRAWLSARMPDLDLDELPEPLYAAAVEALVDEVLDAAGALGNGPARLVDLALDGDAAAGLEHEWTLRLRNAESGMTGFVILSCDGLGLMLLAGALSPVAPQTLDPAAVPVRHARRGRRLHAVPGGVARPGRGRRRVPRRASGGRPGPALDAARHPVGLACARRTENWWWRKPWEKAASHER